MSTLFQNNLDELVDKLMLMSDKVVVAVNDAIEALKNNDIVLAKQVKKNDKHINNLRWEIEEKSITLIATQQPVAKDLRELIAILNLITELERIGDYAVGIARITIKIGDELHAKPLIDIPRMGIIATDMIEQSMKAYINRDEKSARRIHSQDVDLDELYYQIYRELISYMIEKPSLITNCMYLQWVSHNLERMGDRVTNICERIIYLVTGELAEDL